MADLTAQDHVETWKDPSAAGQAFLFSFPYFLLMRKEPELPILTGAKGDANIRLYPPFRSAPATFIGAPEIDPRKVPFLRRVRTNDDRLDNFAVLPSFEMDDADGQPILLLHADSIRIDVTSGKDENVLARIAREVAVVFLKSVRVACRQWWIGHPYAVFAGDLRNVFSIDAFGMPLDRAHWVGNVRTFAGFERPLDRKIFRAAFGATLAGNTPPIVDEILLDGILEEMKGDLGKATLNFAIACEMERDAFFEVAWKRKQSGRPFRRGAAYPGSDLPKHLDGAMTKLMGTSLRAESPELWERLRKLWLLRNDVAHGALIDREEIKTRFEAIGPARETASEVVQWMRLHPSRKQ